MESKKVFSRVFGEMGLPVVIGSFDEDEKVVYPFIEYHRNRPEKTDADDVGYHRTDNWHIELYSKKKDAWKHWELTDKLESLLDGEGINYDISEDIFVDAAMYTVFEFSLPR